MTERAERPEPPPESAERPERPERIVEPVRPARPRPVPIPPRKIERGFTIRRLIAYLACFAAGALAVTGIDWWRASLEPSARAPWGMVLVRPTGGAPRAAQTPSPARPPAVQPLAGAAAGLPVPGGGRRALGLPIRGLPRTSLRDTFTESRSGERVHGAIDIMAPRGTPIVAVDEGAVAKLYNSKSGGITLYQFDPTRTYAYYYAHLDRYSDGLREGVYVRRGDVIGYVGSTGNAAPDAPHLHFQIFRLGPTQNWWEGMPINPYPFLAGAAS